MAEKQTLSKEEIFPPDEALILVAFIPSPRDLHIARVFGWYRIPFRYAPKIVSVDYLAFYQPAAFGNGHSNCIECIAEVRGVELTTRREIIRDEPNHPRADQEYYKLQIGKLVSLPVPIKAGKWKRITFLYTTGGRLRTAKTINDLVVASEERKILWRSLRERSSKFQTKEQSLPDDFDLDKNILMMLGELNLLRDEDNLFDEM